MAITPQAKQPGTPLFEKFTKLEKPKEKEKTAPPPNTKPLVKSIDDSQKKLGELTQDLQELRANKNQSSNIKPEKGSNPAGSAQLATKKGADEAGVELQIGYELDRINANQRQLASITGKSPSTAAPTTTDIIPTTFAPTQDSSPLEVAGGETATAQDPATTPTNGTTDNAGGNQYAAGRTQDCGLAGLAKLEGLSVDAATLNDLRAKTGVQGDKPLTGDELAKAAPNAQATKDGVDQDGKPELILVSNGKGGFHWLAKKGNEVWDPQTGTSRPLTQQDIEDNKTKAGGSTVELA